MSDWFFLLLVVGKAPLLILENFLIALPEKWDSAVPRIQLIQAL
jgi:hypothetical protein